MHRPSRPKSAKGRTRPNRYTCSEATKSTTGVKSEQQPTTKTTTLPTSSVADSPSSSSFDFPRVLRPVSSLSKYRILPGISSGVSDFQSQNFFNNLSSLQNENQLKYNNQIQQHQPMHELNCDDNLKIDNLTISDSISEIENIDSKKPPISLESNQQLLIALKLPDGTRVEKYFQPNDTPKQILISAYHHRPAVVGGPALCDLFQIDEKVDFKKHLLSDMESSLLELGISDRTLLYVERNDYED